MCQETADLAERDGDEAAARAFGAFAAVTAGRRAQHGEGDVPVPGVVAADLVLVEADLVLGGLEAFLDRPAGAGDADQVLVGGSGRGRSTGSRPAPARLWRCG